MNVNSNLLFNAVERILHLLNWLGSVYLVHEIWSLAYNDGLERGPFPISVVIFFNVEGLS